MCVEALLVCKIILCLRGLDTLSRLFAIFQGRQLFLWLPVCCPAYQSPSVQRSTLKGKNLLPLGANSFLLEQTPLEKGDKAMLTELHPLKVYLFFIWQIGLYSSMITLNPLGFSPLWFEPRSGHMWESQVLLTDGQVVFLRVLRFSPTFDERSARYKWNILERAVKPKSKKKKKKNPVWSWFLLFVSVLYI